MSSLQSEIIILVFGMLLFCVAIYGMVSGKTWKPRSVSLTRRSDSPMDFWSGIIMYFLASIMLIAHSLYKITELIHD